MGVCGIHWDIYLQLIKSLNFKTISNYMNKKWRFNTFSHSLSGPMYLSSFLYKETYLPTFAFLVPAYIYNNYIIITIIWFNIIINTDNNKVRLNCCRKPSWKELTPPCFSLSLKLISHQQWDHVDYLATHPCSRFQGQQVTTGKCICFKIY